MDNTLLKQPKKAPTRTNNDIVESASVTALMRYLMSDKNGLAKNPDYLGYVFVNGKWRDFLNDPEKSIQHFQSSLPGILYYHLIRTKHFDCSLLQWINKYPNSQLVILGAGYDSRPIRYQSLLKDNNIKTFEVDLKALLDYKQQAIREKLNIDLADVEYVSCNFQKDNVIDRLKEHGFDCDKPTFILLEGVTYFLTEKNVVDYLHLLRDHINAHLQITFDYDFLEFINGNTNYYGGPELYKLTTVDLGEPHLFGLNYDQVEPFAEKHGYHVKSNYTSFMLEALYLRDGFGESVGIPHGFVGITEITHDPS